MKTILASIPLALLPALAPALAQADCPYETRATLSCPTGTQWDTQTKSCVTPAS
ncbi:MAG: hypothetical protein AB7U46_12880 [Paenirhodobacter sp.]|uniref:hypothetical protein n=1 Tax=Paenirhodobacter sp. TaxID=1965326 RepID=UPI003D0F95C2